jgi:hypothetical protein
MSAPAVKKIPGQAMTSTFLAGAARGWDGRLPAPAVPHVSESPPATADLRFAKVAELARKLHAARMPAL